VNDRDCPCVSALEVAAAYGILPLSVVVEEGLDPETLARICDCE